VLNLIVSRVNELFVGPVNLVHHYDRYCRHNNRGVKVVLPQCVEKGINPPAGGIKKLAWCPSMAVEPK
jgi:hypothetical protein